MYSLPLLSPKKATKAQISALDDFLKAYPGAPPSLALKSVRDEPKYRQPPSCGYPPGIVNTSLTDLP